MIVDAFGYFVVTVRVKQNNAQNAVNSLLHHWITKFGPRVFRLQIVVQNILILNLQTFVLQWELDIHQEHLTHHGQMV